MPWGFFGLLVAWIKTHLGFCATAFDRPGCVESQRLDSWSSYQPMPRPTHKYSGCTIRSTSCPTGYFTLAPVSLWLCMCVYIYVYTYIYIYIHTCTYQSGVMDALQKHIYLITLREISRLNFASVALSWSLSTEMVSCGLLHATINGDSWWLMVINGDYD